MTANVRSLEAAVVARGEELMDAAIDELEKRLDLIVPDSGEIHSNKLRQGRTVLRTRFGFTLSALVTYTAPVEGGDVADFTEYGTEAHDIYPRRPAFALHFFWPKVGGFVFFDHVNWKPGPGVARNLGWFSTTIATWPEVVRDAADGLR